MFLVAELIGNLSLYGLPRMVARAADHLEGREPGTITIVGHTDDVLDADYDQKLSENALKPSRRN